MITVEWNGSYNDVHAIAANLKTDDIIEINTLYSVDHWEGIYWSVQESDAYFVIKIDEEAVLLCGAKDSTVWMVSTPKIDKLMRFILRNHKSVLDLFNQPILKNTILSTSIKTIRLLERLGFEVVPDGEDRFTIIRT
jgi:hypothetical protein